MIGQKTENGSTPDNSAGEGLALPKEWPADFRFTEESGLTEAEAEARRQAGQSGALPENEGKSLREILAGNCLTLFNGLNLGLAVCLALVGSWRNMLFMGVVVANILIGTIQEYRAQKTIQQMKLLNAPTVRVRREGKDKNLRPESCVKGDLVLLRAGDQVTADAMVVEGAGSAVEALLTGESDAVEKGVNSWLYSGSYIAEGSMTAQLVYVGEESYIGRLTKEARKTARPESRMMTELKKLIRADTMVLVPLGILLFLKQILLAGHPVTEAVPSTVASMLGMIPEGLILLTSVAMAVGVIRLGKRQTLVQELAGIETLARVDILCLDKTGTITTGEMETSLIEGFEATEAETEQALARFLGAFGDEGSTLKALRRRVTPLTEKPRAVLPFSSERKKSAATFEDGTTLILGAAEFVLGEQVPERLGARIQELASEGKRVLILAGGHGLATRESLPEIEKIYGLMALSDQIRPGARETLSYFRKEGVELKIISGDHPETVSRLAKEAGLEGWEKWVDASGIRSREALEEACEKFTVFGRVTPEQKKQLVYALQKKGHNVAMTGDGVNDIPALKAADCSIAMASGSDAARHAAQLTLLTSDFTAMPEILMEGRRVINNITRSASLFLTKTIFSFLLSLLTLVVPGGFYPFQPIQMTLVSGLMVGFPGFVLALEPNRERIRGAFLRTALRSALPAGISVAVCAALAVILGRNGWTQADTSTLATLLAGSLCYLGLIRICWPLTRIRAGLLAAALAGFALCVWRMGHLFFLEPMQSVNWGMFGLLTGVGFAIFVLVDWLGKRFLAKR